MLERKASRLPTKSAKRPRADIESPASNAANSNAASQQPPSQVLRPTRSNVRSVTSSAEKKPPPSAPGQKSAATKKPSPTATNQSTMSTRSTQQLFTVGVRSKPTKPPAKPVSSRPVTRPGPSSVRAGPSSVRARSATPPSTKMPAATDNQASASANKRQKRAPWDTKGKLEDLEREMQLMKRKIEEKENDKQQVVVQKKLEIEQSETNHINQVAALKSEYTQEKTKLTQEIEDAQSANSKLSTRLKDAQREIDNLNDQLEQLTQEMRSTKKELAMVKLSEKEFRLEGEEKSRTITSLKGEVESLTTSYQAAQGTISSLEHDKRLHETERRKLHNQIQELKGNIRVFCRIRPFLSSEKPADESELFTYPDLDQKKLTVNRPSALNESTLNDTLRRQEKLEFGFDRVFQPASLQSTVFEEISQLVQSALDGYNVCIFAYGQTGSGKTYTMQGPDDMDDVTEGMIPRSIQQVFQSADHLKSLGWTYKMEASFLEIYNETIKDLLGNPGEEIIHDIKTASGEVVVTNLTIVPVTQPRQVESLFERATKNRRVAKTMCNSRSSRSHSVFSLKISGQNEVTSETCVGTLNLVDLAGSERLKESKSEGNRLKETQHINTSLSELGNVIMALASKQQHIPYRNSKLTRLLQNSLGGTSKTLMFVNVSPRDEHFNETVNSLRFATKVNNCSIGTARKVSK